MSVGVEMAVPIFGGYEVDMPFIAYADALWTPKTLYSPSYYILRTDTFEKRWKRSLRPLEHLTRVSAASLHRHHPGRLLLVALVNVNEKHQGAVAEPLDPVTER